jgi:hypothetical protein
MRDVLDDKAYDVLDDKISKLSNVYYYPSHAVCYSNLNEFSAAV